MKQPLPEIERGKKMIIIDQDKVEGNFRFSGEVHRKMIMEYLIFEKIDELSATGLVVLQSGGFHTDIEKMKLKDKMNISLTEYDFRVKDKKYKLENVSFV